MRWTKRRFRIDYKPFTTRGKYLRGGQNSKLENNRQWFLTNGVYVFPTAK